MFHNLFCIIGKKRRGQLCALTVAMFFCALLEMMGLSMIMAVCALVVDSGRMAENAVIALLCRWTGLLPGSSLASFLLVALILLYICKGAVLMVKDYALARFIRSFQHGLSAELYESALHSPYAFFMETSAAEVISLLNTDTSRAASYLGAFLRVMTEVLVLATISIFLLAVNPVMTFFVLLGIAASILLTRGFIKPLAYQSGRQLKAANITRMKWINQGVRGIKDIKIAQTESFFSTRYEAADTTVAAMEARHTLLSSVPGRCTEMIMVASVLLYALTLLWSGRDLAAFIPSLSALVVAALRLLPCCNHINSALTQMNYLKSSLETVAAALERARDQRARRQSAPPQREIRLERGVAAEKVTFSYKTPAAPVLRDASIEIPAGTSVGIVGPSGAGKTTLVDLLLGLLPPQEGFVRVDGVPVESCSESYLRQTAYIPQMIFVLDDTIRSNVAFGVPADDVRDEAVWAALEKAALADMVRKLPLGLDTMVGENGIRLSGGERQRLGIARALYQSCRLIVFDEATSALDPETEAAVIQSIQGLHGERTVIIVSHRPSAVQGCDRVYRVEKGAIRLIRETP